MIHDIMMKDDFREKEWLHQLLKSYQQSTDNIIQIAWQLFQYYIINFFFYKILYNKLKKEKFWVFSVYIHIYCLDIHSFQIELICELNKSNNTGTRVEA